MRMTVRNCSLGSLILLSVHVMLITSSEAYAGTVFIRIVDTDFLIQSYYTVYDVSVAVHMRRL